MVGADRGHVIGEVSCCNSAQFLRNGRTCHLKREPSVLMSHSIVCVVKHNFMEKIPFDVTDWLEEF